MIIRKVIYGFVVQVYDTQTQKFVSQEFVAGDDCEYETVAGESIDDGEDLVDGELSLHMVQPE